jgi:selenocysteine lyase/cysteine desulfurase
MAFVLAGIFIAVACDTERQALPVTNKSFGTEGRNMEHLDVKRIREDFPVLKREVNGHWLVYLDNAATSQKPQAMIDRLSELYSHEYARVEEGHTLSREATKVFEGTRAKVAELINAAEPLLKALGTDEAVRASFMFYNTREEATALATALEKIVREAG